MAQRLTEEELRDLKTWVFDIESTGLNASFGLPLSISFVPLFDLKRSSVVTFRIDEFPRYRTAPWDDRPLIEAALEFMVDMQVLVSHYGTDFDVPMVNTWAMRYGQWMDRDIKHIDTYQWAKAQCKASGRSLDSLLVHFQTKTQKYHISALQWRKAMCGDKASLNAVVRHNVHDVLATGELACKILKATWMPYQYVR